LPKTTDPTRPSKELVHNHLFSESHGQRKIAPAFHRTATHASTFNTVTDPLSLPLKIPTPPFLNYMLLFSIPISTIKSISPLTTFPIYGPQNSPHYIPTLKVATAAYAEMFINIKHLMWLSTESRSYTINSNCKKPLDKNSLSLKYK
jgi:hypothetical protein